MSAPSLSSPARRPPWFARPIVAALLVALPFAALDLGLKSWLISLLLAPPREIPLTPWFSLLPVWNHGVSFGLLAGATDWNAYLFSGLAAVVIVLLLRWLRADPRPVPLAGVGLIAGGAVGNAIDRLRYGAVFDYLHLHAADWSFWVFNLADAGISVGVALLVLDGLRRRPTPSTRNGDAVSDAHSSGDPS